MRSRIMENYSISIVGREFSSLVPKGNLPADLFRKEVPLSDLQANLSSFISKIGLSFEKIKSTIPNYVLDEITVNVEISATGGISLIGSVETGASGGITLKFKRCPNE